MLNEYQYSRLQRVREAELEAELETRRMLAAAAPDKHEESVWLRVRKFLGRAGPEDSTTTPSSASPSTE
jgi:hypothetical protein